MVASPLEVTADTSTLVNITIFARFKNAEFYLPVPIDTCPPPPSSIGRTLMKEVATEKKRKSVLEQHGASTSRQFVMNTYNVLAGGATNTAIQITGDKIDQSATNQQETSPDVTGQYGFGQDEGEDMDDFNYHGFGFSLTQRPIGPINGSAKRNMVEPLTNNVHEIAMTGAEHFNSLVSEMSIKYIADHMYFFKDVLWNTSQAPFTTIYRGIITPAMFLVNGRVGPNPGVVQPVTPIDLIIGNFKFYKTNIKIHMSLVGNFSQSGAIRFSVLYGNNDLTTTYEQHASQYYQVIEIKDSKRDYVFNFEMPMNVNMLTCITKHMSTWTALDFLRSSVGTFQIDVVNQLVIGNGVPNNVNLLLFFSCPDLEVFFMKESEVYPQLPPAMAETIESSPGSTSDEEFIRVELEQHSSAGMTETGMGTRRGEAAYNIGNDPKTPSSRVMLPLMPTTTFRQMIKKFYRMPTTAGNLVISPRSLFVVQTAAVQPTLTMQIWNCMYVARRGTFNWKLLSSRVYDFVENVFTNYGFDFHSSVSWSTQLAPTPTEAIGQAANQVFFDVGTDINNKYEVSNSFTCPYNFLINPNYVGSSDINVLDYEGSLVIEASSNTSYVPFVSAGDDQRFALFVGAPDCLVTT